MVPHTSMVGALLLLSLSRKSNEPLGYHPTLLTYDPGLLTEAITSTLP